MTDNVTPTQADIGAAKLAYGTTPFELEELFARHRQAAYEQGVLDGAMQAVREMRK